jgi:hypothetical protein
MEVKGVRRGTQILDNLRNRRRYWEEKEDPEVRKWWKRRLITRTLGRNKIHYFEKWRGIHI